MSIADKGEGGGGRLQKPQPLPAEGLQRQEARRSFGQRLPAIDDMDESQRMPIPASVKDVPVFFVGCDDSFWRRMRRRLSEDGYSCKRITGYDTFMAYLAERAKKGVMVLGKDYGFGPLAPEDQVEALRVIKRLDPGARVIFVAGKDSLNSAEIIAAGADAIVSGDDIRPKSLADNIESVLRLYAENGYVHGHPIICEVADEKALEVDADRVPAVDETMRRFAEVFDQHQRLTRHYTVMESILTSYSPHFGKTIVDVGCGTGHPMRRLIRGMMIPEFNAPEPLRERTNILALDSNWNMLRIAIQGHAELMEQHPNLREKLRMIFVNLDFLEFDYSDLGQLEIRGIDTILASYFIHWANDKKGAVARMAELLGLGGKVISVEEWPPIVTPGPYMSEEMAESIQRNILPINRKTYYGMLRKHGFEEVPGCVQVLKIDDHHKMYGNVFVKVKAD